MLPDNNLWTAVNFCTCDIKMLMNVNIENIGNRTIYIKLKKF